MHQSRRNLRKHKLTVVAPLVCLAVYSGLHLFTIFSPTHSTSIHCPSHLYSHLVPCCLLPLLSHMLALAFIHFLPLLLAYCSQPHTFYLTFSSSLTVSVTHFTSNLSLPFINCPNDTVPPFIVHNSFRIRLLCPSLYRLPPPILVKDLRVPLSVNQVVIRAAKIRSLIRSLINKGLSLLASGLLCLNRWHWSAFWAHQINARTPGVPWNGKQRQSLALDNNEGIGSLLPVFRESLPGLVLHYPRPFVFFPPIMTGLFYSAVGEIA